VDFTTYKPQIENQKNILNLKGNFEMNSKSFIRSLGECLGIIKIKPKSKFMSDSDYYSNSGIIKPSPSGDGFSIK